MDVQRGDGESKDTGEQQERVTGECNFALPVPLIISHYLYGDEWRGTNNF